MSNEPLTLEDISIVPDDARTRTGNDATTEDAAIYIPVKGRDNEILGYYIGSSAFYDDDHINPRPANNAMDAWARKEFGVDDGTVALYDKDLHPIAQLQVTAGFGHNTKLVFASADSAQIGTVLPLSYLTNSHDLVERYFVKREGRVTEVPVVMDENRHICYFNGMEPGEDDNPSQILVGSKHPAYADSTELGRDGFDIVNGKAAITNHDLTIEVPVEVTHIREALFVRSFFMAHHNEMQENPNPTMDQQTHFQDIVRSTARSMDGRQ